MSRRKLALIFLFMAPVLLAAGSRISVTKMGGGIDVHAAPHGASLNTMGGDIRIGSADGEVVARTMGGNIEVRQLSGGLLARSMGGNVRVRVVGSGGGRTVALHTMGGTVDLIVPRDFDATFHVEVTDSDSDHGSIVSDIPLTESTASHWTMFDRRRRTITGVKTRATQSNHVEISTYGSTVTIRRE